VQLPHPFVDYEERVFQVAQVGDPGDIVAEVYCVVP